MMDNLYRGQTKEDPGTYHRAQMPPAEPYSPAAHMGGGGYGYYPPPMGGAHIPPNNLMWMGAPKHGQQPIKDPMIWDPPSPKRD